MKNLQRALLSALGLLSVTGLCVVGFWSSFMSANPGLSVRQHLAMPATSNVSVSDSVRVSVENHEKPTALNLHLPVKENEMDRQHIFAELSGNSHNISNVAAPKKRVSDFSMRLSPKVIEHVKKFVFFVGYPRSGHSIVGTLMDAHPHVVISHEFNLFSSFDRFDGVPESEWKETLFDIIYKKSHYDVKYSRHDSAKGYSLGVNGLWQGKFNRHIDVIGDKSGDVTTRSYMRNRTEFLRNYKLLKKMIGIPVYIIHVLRNPFDMIATGVVISKNVTAFRTLKNSADSKVEKFNKSKTLDSRIGMVFNEYKAALELVTTVFGRDRVLDVHNCDLVADPKATISRIFKFLHVRVPDQYLRDTSQKVFKAVSRSRDMVVWTEEQKRRVESMIEEFKMLRRYSFTSD